MIRVSQRCLRENENIMLCYEDLAVELFQRKLGVGKSITQCVIRLEKILKVGHGASEILFSIQGCEFLCIVFFCMESRNTLLPGLWTGTRWHLRCVLTDNEKYPDAESYRQKDKSFLKVLYERGRLRNGVSQAEVNLVI